LPELQKKRQISGKPGVIRGMSVYASVDKDRSPLLVGGLPIQWPNSSWPQMEAISSIAFWKEES
jgi:hypothetical protein